MFAETKNPAELGFLYVSQYLDKSNWLRLSNFWRHWRSVRLGCWSNGRFSLRFFRYSWLVCSSFSGWLSGSWLFSGWLGWCFRGWFCCSFSRSLSRCFRCWLSRCFSALTSLRLGTPKREIAEFKRLSNASSSSFHLPSALPLTPLTRVLADSTDSFTTSTCLSTSVLATFSAFSPSLTKLSNNLLPSLLTFEYLFQFFSCCS